MTVMPKVIYDHLNHDSLVPTFLHLQLADQLIRLPVGTTEHIPVRIGNFFMPVDFLVFVDVSYADSQAHRIINVALHREYPPGIVFIFFQWSNDLYHV
jgi:hypothetical protein